MAANESATTTWNNNEQLNQQHNKTKTTTQAAVANMQNHAGLSEYFNIEKFSHCYIFQVIHIYTFNNFQPLTRMDRMK